MEHLSHVATDPHCYHFDLNFVIIGFSFPTYLYLWTSNLICLLLYLINKVMRKFNLKFNFMF